MARENTEYYQQKITIMKEITLKGSFYEMGQQYGTQFKKQLKLMLFELKLMAISSEKKGRDFFRPKPQHMIASIFKMRKYRKIYHQVAAEFEVNIKKYYPEILELIKGMADSTNIDYRDLIFVNCMVEYSLKCSAFAATGDATTNGSPLIGMNADESKSIQKYYITINMEPYNGYRFTATYIGGTIFPVFGMNEHGLSFASMLLFLDNQEFSNLRKPQFLKFSVLHNCKSVAEAKELFESIPASGIGTATYVADSKQLLVQEENSALKQTIVYETGTHHTANFPKTNELQKFVKIDSLDDISFFFAKDRQRRIGNLFEKYMGCLDEDTFYSILSDHGSDEDDTLNKSVCVHPENTKGIKTCASIILNPAGKKMKIFTGNPCEGNVKKYEF